MSLLATLQDLGDALEAEIEAVGAGEVDGLDGFLARKRAALRALEGLGRPEGDPGDAVRRQMRRVRELLGRDAAILERAGHAIGEVATELRRVAGHDEPTRAYGADGRSTPPRETRRTLDKSL